MLAHLCRETSNLDHRLDSVLLSLMSILMAHVTKLIDMNTLVIMQRPMINVSLWLNYNILFRYLFQFPLQEFPYSSQADNGVRTLSCIQVVDHIHTVAKHN